MYALKYLEPLAEGEDISGLLTGEDAKKPSLQPRLFEPEGDFGVVKKLIGYREGEWFREWEELIKRCASMRVQREEPFARVQDGPVDPAMFLDGYAEGQAAKLDG